MCQQASGVPFSLIARFPGLCRLVRGAPVARALRRLALGTATLLAATLASACDLSGLSESLPGQCSEAGAQCQLATGPLGVCEQKLLCAAGEAEPCFLCVSQH